MKRRAATPVISRVVRKKLIFAFKAGISAGLQKSLEFQKLLRLPPVNLWSLRTLMRLSHSALWRLILMG
jgi:hypothetical protein